MTNYYPLIAQAVSNLDRNTLEARQALYERARAVLVEQLGARTPSVLEADITRECLALESAICKVELESTAGQFSEAGATSDLPSGSSSKPPVADSIHEGRGGRIKLAKDKASIELFTNVDAFTFMHQSAHLFLEQYIRDAAKMGEGSQLNGDLNVVLKWLGVEKPEDITSAHHEQWALGFEQYLAEGRAPSTNLVRSFEHFKRAAVSRRDFGTSIPDEIRRVFDRMLATDQEITQLSARPDVPIPSQTPSTGRTFLLTPEQHRRQAALLRQSNDPKVRAHALQHETLVRLIEQRVPQQTAPRLSQFTPTHVPGSLDLDGVSRSTTQQESVLASQTEVLVVKGVLGFVVGFVLVFGLEVLAFGGMEFLSGHRLRPVGAGWIVMPILAGCAGWKLFREIDLAAAIGVKRVYAELKTWPRRHKLALALVVAIGWIAGVLLGFFVSVAGRADYYPRTLETWLFGRWYWPYGGEISVRHFPWASLRWGFAGGVVGAAIVYARQLLQSKAIELVNSGESEKQTTLTTDRPAVPSQIPMAKTLASPESSDQN